MKCLRLLQNLPRWWDIRNFGKATREWLVVRDESVTDPDKGEGVCSLSFEPTMSSKFMVRDKHDHMYLISD